MIFFVDTFCNLVRWFKFRFLSKIFWNLYLCTSSMYEKIVLVSFRAKFDGFLCCVRLSTKFLFDRVPSCTLHLFKIWDFGRIMKTTGAQTLKIWIFGCFCQPYIAKSWNYYQLFWLRGHRPHKQLTTKAQNLIFIKWFIIWTHLDSSFNVPPWLKFEN
jgi:hypothetical protein